MRKRIKKYTGGGVTAPATKTTGLGDPLTQGLSMFGNMGGQAIRQLDMEDGHLSGVGAFGSGAMQGAAMGAALGPIGALAGGVIGGAYGLFTQKSTNDKLREAEELERKEERLRAQAERTAELAAMDAVLDQHPVKGVSNARFEKGGPTQPERKYSLADLPRPALQAILDSDKLMDAAATLDYNEMESLIQMAGKTQEEIKDMSDAEKLGYFSRMDLSFVKPLRKKAGLSKGEIVDEAVNAGLIKKGMGLPVKAAAMFKDFEMGGPTGVGEKYHAIPNYNGSMDPNATPSMDFYYMGKKVAPQEFAKMLPGDTTINDVAAYGLSKASPAFNPQLGWTNIGRNEYMSSFMKSQGQTPDFAMGGATAPKYEAEGGEMIQYKDGDKPKVYGKGGLSQVSSNEAEIKGPKHSGGGVNMSDDKGARIYSDKLTVDAALYDKLSKL